MEKKYGLFRFLIDLGLTVLTGGLWMLYLSFKFIRKQID